MYRAAGQQGGKMGGSKTGCGLRSGQETAGSTMS